ncbi:MAG: hypothetical protein ACK5NF_06970 [Bacilli bacterium]
MKNILIILTIFLLVGCTNKYVVTFNEDKTVTEYIEFTEDIAYYAEHDPGFGHMEEKPSDYAYLKKQYPNHKIKQIDNDEKYGYTLKHPYESITDYIKNNVIGPKEAFYKYKVFEKKGVFTITSSYFQQYDTLTMNNIGNNKFEYILSAPFKLIDSNADIIDFDKNVHTWIMTPTNPERNIKFSIDTNSKYSKFNLVYFRYLLSTWWFWLILVLCIILIVGICLVIYLVSKNKRNNIL